MKILLVVHLIPYPPTGGVTLRNFNLLKELSVNNEIYMLAFHQKVHEKDNEKLIKNIEETKKYCKYLEVFDIPTDRNKFLWYGLLLLNLLSLKPYSAWRFYSPKMVKAIKNLLRVNEFDVMEIGTIALANYGKLAQSLPKVLVHHNIESKLLERRSKYLKNWFSKIYMRYQAWKLRRFEHVTSQFINYHTTCSKNDKDLLQQIAPGSKVIVVPNGVDIDYFQVTSDKADVNSLIYVGGMTWFPNYDAMLYFMKDIWPLVKKETPECKMNHIGRQLNNEFFDIAKKDNSLKFHGFVDDIRTEMTKASVYIVPLRVGGGTRLKVLDALSMGCAIVSTSIGCEGIDVKDGFDVLIADSNEDFAQKIISLFKDSKFREVLQKNARKTAEEKYAWSKIAPIYRSVFDQFVNIK